MIPALIAVLLGVVVILRKKGTSSHKKSGWVWVLLMYFVAISSLFIVGGPLEIYNGYGYIHLFSALTIITLTMALWSVRKKRYVFHAFFMVSTYFGLIGAGIAATLMPDRMLHDFIFL